ncbi:hypothetical protein NUH30_19585 [Leptospira sp. 85282-16]|uniref:hypothetical protein n=1 Tax=Leptospira sp. 85282-16 TaxID=2971256 RepID=UPI0021C167C1|nr:hypothetical protein [Leptospira sp. 85282-16]MCT8335899.1 hypothetical protein [Leptospira sp. 85282-16]
MNFGPISISDKSAFQGFSKREFLFYLNWFHENLTPILVMEIFSDLSKFEKENYDKAIELANKFGGSGNPTNADYLELLIGSLLGKEIIMNGKILFSHGTPFNDKETNTKGLFIDITPINSLLLRIATNKLTEEDKEFSKTWRKKTLNFDIDTIYTKLNQRKLILPQPKREEEITPIAIKLLSNKKTEKDWLLFFLDIFLLTKPLKDKIYNRWQASKHIYKLSNFAPYAYHCFLSFLTVVIATKHGIIKNNPTNFLDLNYIYYLPFCQVFISNDRLHKLLVPQLKRENQFFVTGEDMKKDIKRILNDIDLVKEEHHPLSLKIKNREFPNINSESLIESIRNKCLVPGAFS